MKDHRTWVEISRSAVLHNVGTIRKLVGDGRIICSAVKANAYGHGMVEIAPLILEGGADWLGVDSLAEAMTLRESGITAPVYIMGAILPEELEIAVKEGFHFVVYDEEILEKLKEVTERLDLPALTHLKLETGTNRQGILESQIPKIAGYFRDNVRLQLKGVATHFARIEDDPDPVYASSQLEQFTRMSQKIRQAGLNPEYEHCANSAACILYPQTYFNMVRPGIANYGMWPSETTRTRSEYSKYPVELRPVLTWKTRVAHVKFIPKDSFVGYGDSFQAPRDTYGALIPVGYDAGITRSLTNVGHVLIHGEKAKIIGRVAMNMTMVDVTDIPATGMGDEVVIIGKQHRREIMADDIAKLQGTINYEVTTRINPNIERVVVESNEPKRFLSFDELRKEIK